jgi:hypothetical protein
MIAGSPTGTGNKLSKIGPFGAQQSQGTGQIFASRTNLESFETFQVR